MQQYFQLTRLSSPHKACDAFDVRRVREHIYRLNLNNCIAVFNEDAEIAKQACGMARDIDDVLRRHADERI